jgi:LysR family transcriptional regulator for metE and metH
MLPQFEHAERSLQGFARGTRGSLRIGMECHPCYQWLRRCSPSSPRTCPPGPRCPRR